MPLAISYARFTLVNQERPASLSSSSSRLPPLIYWRERERENEKKREREKEKKRESEKEEKGDERERHRVKERQRGTAAKHNWDIHTQIPHITLTLSFSTHLLYTQ